MFRFGRVRVLMVSLLSSWHRPSGACVITNGCQRHSSCWTSETVVAVLLGLQSLSPFAARPDLIPNPIAITVFLMVQSAVLDGDYRGCTCGECETVCGRKWGWDQEVSGFSKYRCRYQRFWWCRTLFEK
ncbi:hypothetical protein ARMSODRAFT_48566 [Armillaria solidipes]|uniref:Secreted protein n=1 Tax=Armillaria solidipes TaxID=1076256 RepID=A0A2H3CBD4_9AGAR|nr:hypothetical protein ARMSODRAFT_48566 [Armillaria solidipes]